MPLQPTQHLSLRSPGAPLKQPVHNQAATKATRATAANTARPAWTPPVPALDVFGVELPPTACEAVAPAVPLPVFCCTATPLVVQSSCTQHVQQSSLAGSLFWTSYPRNGSAQASSLPLHHCTGNESGHWPGEKSPNTSPLLAECCSC